MKKISLFICILASVLITSCAPILTGEGNNVPNDHEQMGGSGYPTLRDRDSEPCFFNDGSPSRPLDGHDNDRDLHHGKDRDHDRDNDSDNNRTIHREVYQDRNQDFSIDRQRDQIQVHEVRH